MSELLEKNRDDELNIEEGIELDEFLRMNRFMSRPQARAKQNIQKGFLFNILILRKQTS